MTSGTFKSAGKASKITVNPTRSDGKKHPAILLVHGNFGLSEPYGAQLHGFAQDLTRLEGYITAVPQYYEDDKPHPDDMVPHDQTLADADRRCRRTRRR